MVIGSIEHLPISTRVSRFGRHKRVDIFYVFLSKRKTIKYERVLNKVKKLI
ncbi:hypothetical protein CU026_2464 [Enterococcus faecium]|uniref:Transposase n=1 Tax=Enterococcus faecium (strain ATCC BAA-472 / TX0016 / DO) TaxID=333849 RepID=I3U649_ENTFD|nr:hypothetical protein HMPREF0351_12863 [Enterococcus faecium DO]EEI61607.1 hypothetical protein HMPREF0352_0128 [Enterococcus faecium TX1330]EEV60494.1 predicted protein [Enterococcus faecium Com12]EPI10823.1 hypothetical protein D357_01350 [Enterococcus faecium SD3B-2]KAF3371989.1 hypothetical protein BXA51_10945 [Enterococcus faecium]MBL5007151.1 hypothetical protein [Enterococcus lactis]